MSTWKLVGLLLISFVATGSVIFQIRNSGASKTSVASPQAGTAASIDPPVTAPVPLAAQAPSPATAQKTARVRIPASGWGRNPFLTIDEINRLNQPEPAVVTETLPTPSPEAPKLPAYSLSGIITGRLGNLAIVDGRTVRAGSRIGPEIVKEVREHEVVLDYQGQLRELRMKSIEETAAAAPPKKETKP